VNAPTIVTAREEPATSGTNGFLGVSEKPAATSRVIQIDKNTRVVRRWLGGTVGVLGKGEHLIFEIRTVDALGVDSWNREPPDAGVLLPYLSRLIPRDANEEAVAAALGEVG
jgi:hypothetical protein